MQYRSFSDLSRDILTGICRLPRDLDLIVGIPRSGLMAASILSLHRNLRFCDVNGFIDNKKLATGSTRSASNAVVFPHSAKNVLVLDDSVWSGAAINKARTELNKFCGQIKFTYAAVYATKQSRNLVDHYFCELPTPRFFEWNLFHRHELNSFCVDIDGVLCHDPSTEENDDGARYIDFLHSARPLARPTQKIGHLVTSRLEKYRPATEAWLRREGVIYDTLHMLDLPNAQERRRLGRHASFKASIYASIGDSVLFIESESSQATEIAKRSGKPVLDFGEQRMILPGLGLPLVMTNAMKARRKVEKLISKALTGRAASG